MRVSCGVCKELCCGWLLPLVVSGKLFAFAQLFWVAGNAATDCRALGIFPWQLIQVVDNLACLIGQRLGIVSCICPVALNVYVHQVMAVTLLNCESL